MTLSAPRDSEGAIVRVLLLAIDACDREIVVLSAVAGAGVSSEMVRDIMIFCVERRFGGTHAAHPVEWLSDNSSTDIAAEPADTATAIGLKPAFTPVRSPESNGISESFVKTLRRDYVRRHVLINAETVMGLLPVWFEDYNHVHPHSGSRFLSPREFRAVVLKSTR